MEGLGAIRRRPLLEVPSYNMPYLRRMCYCSWTFGCNDRIGECIDTNRHQRFELMCATICAALQRRRRGYREYEGTSHLPATVSKHQD